MPDSKLKKLKKLKIALVGCGQIADAHLQEIRKISTAVPVAVCDHAIAVARQAAAPFRSARRLRQLLDQMLIDRETPDVLHIATPPQTHCDIALRAFARGIHAYIEKPFTVDAADADRILTAAKRHNLLVCVGHDHLFDPAWVACRKRWQSGEFGRPVHIDSVQGYNLGGPFGKMFASEPDHWVHRLPGGLFQNVMSHALYRITEFMPDEDPAIWATWFGQIPGSDTATELRVMLRGEDVSANLMFTSTARPVQRVARIYGTRGTMEVDLDSRVIRVYRDLKLPGPFRQNRRPLPPCHRGPQVAQTAASASSFAAKHTTLPA